MNPNTSTNGTPQSTTDERSENNVSKSFQTTAYVVVFLLSVVGNSFVLIVMKKNLNGARKVVTNVLIAHLALADILTSICGIPVMIWRIWKGDEWIDGGTFGKILCKLDPFILETSFAVSAFTISLISFERYVIIYYPTKKILTCRRAFGVGLIAWLLLAVFYSPKLYTLTIIKHQNIIVCSALDNRIKPWREIESVMFLTLLVFVLSFYLSIIIKVRVHNKAHLSASPRSRLRIEAREKINRRVLCQSSTIVFVHYFCWMPYLFIYLSCLLSKSTLEYCHSEILVRFLAMFFGYCNAAANPLLYASFSDSFRSGFRLLLYRVVFYGDKVMSATQVRQGNDNHLASGPIKDAFFIKRTCSPVADPPNDRNNRRTKFELVEIRQLKLTS